MPVFPTLYTVDSTGKVRTWAMEQDGNRYRTLSGIEGGAIVESGWTTCVGKNIGKKNETSPEMQAAAEIDAEYKKKRKRKYYDDRDHVGGAKFFDPMLAKKFEPAKAFFPCWLQPKLDGIRCIIKADGAWTRKGEPILTIPHILDDLAPHLEASPDLILDGELYNHELKDDFNLLTSMIRQQTPDAGDLKLSREMVQYHAYDLASHSGVFSQRTKDLKIFLGLVSSEYMKYVPTYYVEALDELKNRYEDFLALGYEGGMVRLDGLYEAGKRSKSLQKWKEFMDAEFEIVQILEGNGNWAGYAKIVEFYLPDGRTCRAGVKGNREFTKKLLGNPQGFTHTTIRYFTPTPDGMPRFPVAVDWHVGERKD